MNQFLIITSILIGISIITYKFFYLKCLDTFREHLKEGDECIYINEQGEGINVQILRRKGYMLWVIYPESSQYIKRKQEYINIKDVYPIDKHFFI